MKDKKEQAKLINDIQGKTLEIFFDLEEFSDFDSGSVAQNTTLKLIDEITTIRRNILKKPEDES